jgi:hypothetical protein
MKRYHLLLLAVASAPLLVHAEPVHTSTAAMDANAAVPQLHYQSAFAEYKSVEKPKATPDKVWVRSNQQVSGQESSVDSEAMPMQMNHAPAVQDKPAAVPAADPHKGHNMNMKGH